MGETRNRACTLICYVYYICIYLDLPKCVKWLLRGVKLPFLRVLLAPLGRCWYMILSNFRGVYSILSTIVVSFGTSVHLTMSKYVNIYNYNSHPSYVWVIFSAHPPVK